MVAYMSFLAEMGVTKMGRRLLIDIPDKEQNYREARNFLRKPIKVTLEQIPI